MRLALCRFMTAGTMRDEWKREVEVRSLEVVLSGTAAWGLADCDGSPCLTLLSGGCSWRSESCAV